MALNLNVSDLTVCLDADLLDQVPHTFVWSSVLQLDVYCQRCKQQKNTHASWLLGCLLLGTSAIATWVFKYILAETLYRGKQAETLHNTVHCIPRLSVGLPCMICA